MKTIRSMKGFLFYVAGVVFVATAVLLLAGCMDPLGRESTAAAGISVMNAPSTVTELELTVSGPGMSTIQRTLTPGTSSITLEVPVGVNRVFDLTGGWFTFRRSFSVSPAGLSVPANMGSYIVVDDTWNDRIVFMRDMSGVGWEELTGLPEFMVRDEGIFPGFDHDGRLTFASATEGFTVWSFDDPTSGGVPSNPVGGFSPTFDRATNRWYFSNFSGNIAFSEYVDSVLSAPTVVLEDYPAWVTAMVVGDDGYLYVGGFVGQFPLPDQPRIDKVNVVTGEVVRTFEYDSLFVDDDYFEPVAVTFVNGAIFVINTDWDIGRASDGNMVFKLDTNLNLLGRFGSFPQNTNDPQPGEFYGPQRFVTTVPRRLIAIDGSQSLGVDRLVSFNDIGTAGWRTFGSNGTGEGQFRFFC